MCGRSWLQQPPQQQLRQQQTVQALGQVLAGEQPTAAYAPQTVRCCPWRTTEHTPFFSDGCIGMVVHVKNTGTLPV
jgi:hypothetical protein